MPNDEFLYGITVLRAIRPRRAASRQASRQMISPVRPSSKWCMRGLVERFANGSTAKRKRAVPGFPRALEHFRERLSRQAINSFQTHRPNQIFRGYVCGQAGSRFFPIAVRFAVFFQKMPRFASTNRGIQKLRLTGRDSVATFQSLRATWPSDGSRDRLHLK